MVLVDDRGSGWELREIFVEGWRGGSYVVGRACPPMLGCVSRLRLSGGKPARQRERNGKKKNKKNTVSAGAETVCKLFASAGC